MFCVDNLWTKADEEESMSVAYGKVVFMTITGPYVGYIDACSTTLLKKEE